MKSESKIFSCKRPNEVVCINKKKGERTCSKCRDVTFAHEFLMNKIKPKTIEVYADWLGLSEPTLVGVLSATTSKDRFLTTTKLKHLHLGLRYVN